MKSGFKMISNPGRFFYVLSKKTTQSDSNPRSCVQRSLCQAGLPHNMSTSPPIALGRCEKLALRNRVFLSWSDLLYLFLWIVIPGCVRTLATLPTAEHPHQFISGTVGLVPRHKLKHPNPL
eukprot:6492685-Amphidinium_carterae.10